MSPVLKPSDIRTNLHRPVQLHFVCARLSHQIRSAQKTLEGSGVCPPPFQLLPRHLTTFDVSVVNVGDFQLAATGRLQCANDVKHFAIVHVDSDHGVFRFWRCGLLFNTQYALAAEFGNAKTFRIGHLLQYDLGPLCLFLIRLDRAGNIALNDVSPSTTQTECPAAKCSTSESASAIPPSPS